jgi:hypothetical protein
MNSATDNTNAINPTLANSRYQHTHGLDNRFREIGLLQLGHFDRKMPASRTPDNIRILGAPG